MPIQFRCQKCNKWLEVDEEHAGQKAACPFCQAVNDVPRESAAPTAEEAGPGPFTNIPTEQTTPGAPEVPVSKPLKQQERSRPAYDQGWFDAGRAGLPPPPVAGRWLSRLGYLGLALSLIAIAMFFTAMVILMSYLPPELRERMTQTGASAEDARQVQQQLLEIAQKHTWVIAVIFGGFLLNIVGFAMSLMSALTPGPHRKAAAWIGTIIGGSLFFCLCLNMMRSFAGS